MKKLSVIAAGVAVVIAASWTGAAWYTGKRIEAERTGRIEETNRDLARLWPGREVKLQELAYERGIFSSHARYGLSDAGQGEAPWLAPGTVEIDVLAHHGPFPLAALARGSFAPRLAEVHAELARTAGVQALYDAAAGKPPVSADIAFSYNGDSRGEAGIAPLSTIHDGRKLSFGGARMQSEYLRSRRESRLALQTGALTLDGADLGSGELVMQAGGPDAEPQVVINPLAWKTDKGASRVTATLQAMGLDTAQDLAELPVDELLRRHVRRLEVKVALSRPMLSELIGRWLALVEGLPAEAAGRQASRQVAGMAGMAQMLGLGRNEGDNLVSDFSYAEGRAVFNGRERDLGALLPR